MSAQKTYPPEYLEGIKLFNRGEYYEAHEAWEKIWLCSHGEEKLFYQGLIQTAATLLKLQENKMPAAAQRLREAALDKLSKVKSPFMGLDILKIVSELEHPTFKLTLNLL
ncbi:MAG: DUF309 domain-containing protein [Phaeospirillum sp.]|nr:DUF309 domain-containing protein [Phaeospirillum sp.]